VDRFAGRLRTAAIVAAVAGLAAPVAAATRTTSFGVSVTVVASCQVVAGSPSGCAPSAHAAGTTGSAGAPVAAPKPVVTFTKDPKTGTVIQTIVF
jgi:hypothetical protein